jgi:hypothetical protein
MRDKTIGKWKVGTYGETGDSLYLLPAVELTIWENDIPCFGGEKLTYVTMRNVYFFFYLLKWRYVIGCRKQIGNK